MLPLKQRQETAIVVVQLMLDPHALLLHWTAVPVGVKPIVLMVALSPLRSVPESNFVRLISGLRAPFAQASTVGSRLQLTLDGDIEVAVDCSVSEPTLASRRPGLDALDSDA